MHMHGAFTIYQNCFFCVCTRLDEMFIRIDVIQNGAFKLTCCRILGILLLIYICEGLHYDYENSTMIKDDMKINKNSQNNFEESRSEV